MLNSTADEIMAESSGRTECSAGRRTSASASQSSHGILSSLHDEEDLSSSATHEQKIAPRQLSTSSVTQSNSSPADTRQPVRAPRAAQHPGHASSSQHGKPTRAPTTSRPKLRADSNASGKESTPSGSSGLVHIPGMTIAAAESPQRLPRQTSELQQNATQSSMAAKEKTTRSATTKSFSDASKRVQHYKQKLSALLERSVTSRTLPAILEARYMWSLAGHCATHHLNAFGFHYDTQLLPGRVRRLWLENKPQFSFQYLLDIPCVL